MQSVGVIGYNGREISKAFLRMSKGKASCYHITEKQPHGPKVNVLVAAQASPVLATVIPTLSKDDYLIVNADEKEILPILKNACAKLITYGFNTRTCITASSVTEDSLHVCIQRGFRGADGTDREPSEFSAKMNPGENAISVLGAAAAWSVLQA